MAETKTVKFYSKYKNLKVVLRGTKTIIQDGMAIIMQGKTIQFENYQYETADKEEITLIKRSKAFGIDILEEKAEG